MELTRGSEGIRVTAAEVRQDRESGRMERECRPALSREMTPVPLRLFSERPDGLFFFRGELRGFQDFPDGFLPDNRIESVLSEIRRHLSRVAEIQDGESPRGGHHGVVRLIPELFEHSQIPLKPFLIRVVAEEHHAGETHVEFPV